jgi:hypothetical protein
VQINQFKNQKFPESVQIFAYRKILNSKEFSKQACFFTFWVLYISAMDTQNAWIGENGDEKSKQKQSSFNRPNRSTGACFDVDEHRIVFLIDGCGCR